MISADLVPRDKEGFLGRLDRLSKLPRGWHNGYGEAPDPLVCSYIELLCLGDGLPHPLPFLFPRVEGGLQMEWEIDGHQVTLEVYREEDVLRGLYHRIHIPGGQELEKKLDFGTVEGLTFVCNDIRCLHAKHLQSQTDKV